MIEILIVIVLSLFICILGVYGYMFLCKNTDIEFSYYGDRTELRSIDNLKISKIRLSEFECIAFIPYRHRYIIFTFNFIEIFDLKPNIF